MNTTIVLALFALLLVALVGIVIALAMGKKNVPAEKAVRARSLQDLINEGRAFSGTNLQSLIDEFIETQKLPFRQSENLSADAKAKLEFVRAVASNKNATAKHISYLNRELVKKYGTYKADIESYEKMGLGERK